MTAFKVSIVVPAFNEATNLEISAQKIIEQLVGHDYELIFVDDGSSDDSLAILEAMHKANPAVQYLSFSRNFGHMAALKAGIDHSTGDCVISLDADLQQPPSYIPIFIAKWQEGYDIVYTQRRPSADNSALKNLTSKSFYGLMNGLSEVNFEEGTADFRLIDKAVADIIKNTKEYNLFIRGFISWVGFKQFKVEYDPAKRHSGITKYSFKKMFALALNGITSFSVKPLQLSTIIGAIISVLAFIYGIYAVCIHLFTNRAITGWTSLLVSVLFIGGLQLLMLGIMGQYLGKLFIQSKQRPDYIIRKTSLGTGIK